MKIPSPKKHTQHKFAKQNSKHNSSKTRSTKNKRKPRNKACSKPVANDEEILITDVDEFHSSIQIPHVFKRARSVKIYDKNICKGYVPPTTIKISAPKPKK